MGLNKECLGKSYEETTWDVTADQIKKYAIGYNEDKPQFVDDSKPAQMIAPPLYGVVYSGPCIAQAFFDSELNCNLARLVHGEQDMTFYRPVKAGEKLISVGKIKSIEDKGSGEFFEVEVVTKDTEGNPVQKLISGFFIRGKGGGKKEGGETAPEETPANPTYRDEMKVKENQTYIYAEGSGDYNPIHVDEAFAKSVGFPGIILQGLCSMAFTSKAAYDKLAGGDSTKIKRIKVRFSKPVFPLDTVITEGWEVEEKDDVIVYGFEAKNDKGDKVIKNGVVEIRK